MTESTEPMPQLLTEAAAADIAEQHRSAVPADEPVEQVAPRPDVDEADAWEQGQVVPGDDEEDAPPVG